MPVTRVILSNTSISSFRYSILPSFIILSKVSHFKKTSKHSEATSRSQHVTLAAVSNPQGSKMLIALFFLSYFFPFLYMYEYVLCFLVCFIIISFPLPLKFYFILFLYTHEFIYISFASVYISSFLSFLSLYM
jgi:hypothetical protein